MLLISQRAKDSQRDVHVNALQQIFTLTEKDQIIAAIQPTDYDVAKAAELLSQENKSKDFGETTETTLFSKFMLDVAK